MNQNIWGPHMWFTLHTISFNYPLYPTNEEKKHYTSFIESLKYVIPCGTCKKNFKRTLKHLPLQLNSRQEFVYWLIDIHNEVNSLTGKKIMDRNKVIKLYEKKLNKKIILESITPRKDKKYNIFKIPIIGLILLISFFLLVPTKYIDSQFNRLKKSLTFFLN
jgi:hypothetical protein